MIIKKKFCSFCFQVEETIYAIRIGLQTAPSFLGTQNYNDKGINHGRL